jgi:hypothetical protein
MQTAIVSICALQAATQKSVHRFRFRYVLSAPARPTEAW